MKPIIWCGNVLQRIRDFPRGPRREAGHQLRRVQRGREAEDWRPMTSVGAGVEEIRLHHDGEFRVIYLARFSEAVYVLHAFQKKSRRTSKNDIEMSRCRYRVACEEHRRNL